MIGLKNPSLFKSISAFSPIVSPMTVPWGQKAFQAYLGSDQNSWKDYDSCELILSLGGEKTVPLLVDQGCADDFLEKELQPHKLQEVCKNKKVSLQLRMQEGYDHSYYFISTFIDDHLEFHAQHLK